MTTVAPIIFSLILGWLATLTLQRDRAEVLVLDFLIATFGAGLVAAPASLWFGVSITGVHGVTMAGICLMYAGGIVVLSAANYFRSVRRQPAEVRAWLPPRRQRKQSFVGDL
jgi:uncharacterized membrane protein YeaQ/YmgE (transglycosylase-associated protein family)